MAVYGWDGRAFEPEVLDRFVVGMEIDWMKRYDNTPRLCFIGHPTDDVPVSNLTVGKILHDCLFYCPHPSGFVRYFTHDKPWDRNEGGYGGAVFSFIDHELGELKVAGPWSSRAAVVNWMLDEARHEQVVDICFRCHYNYGTALKLEAVVYLLKKFDADCYLIRGRKSNGGEQGPWTVSMAPDGILKPERSRPTYPVRFDDWEVAYSPGDK